MCSRGKRVNCGVLLSLQVEGMQAEMSRGVCLRGKDEEYPFENRVTAPEGIAPEGEGVCQ